MKIAVIGTGYVGLVTGTCLAEVGYSVTCVDTNQQKISSLNQGLCPIFEPGLEEKVKRNLNRRLFFTGQYEDAIKGAHIIFLALPTPATEDGSADLSYIKQAAYTLAPYLFSGAIIVSKSTVPPGSSLKIKNWIASKTDTPFEIASNPEFLKQGDAVADFMKPDRVVIGVENEQVGKTLQDLYAPFNVNHDRILIMDLVSAEMTKYAANAMLACRISMMNEFAGLCERTGADITKVRLGLGSDHRIGYSFLYAGVGYGGSCFPKDLLALHNMGDEVGYPMPILEAVQEVNQRQQKLFFARILDLFNGNLSDKTFGILGLSFKPETDDLRNAPALSIIERLLSEGARLHLYDPAAIPNAKKLLGNHKRIAWASDEVACATDVDALILVTEWKQFRQLDFEELGARMRQRILFDGRNQYKREEMEEKGFTYISVGQPVNQPCLVS